MIGLLDKRLDVFKAARVADGYGGYALTWTRSSAGVACRVATGPVRPVGDFQGKSDVVADMVVFTEPADISVGDRLLIAGSLYEVVSVKNWNLAGQYLRLEAREVAE